MKDSDYRKCMPCAACLVIICIAFCAWLPFQNLAWDEPHLFYRYAQNFAAGNGLVFNTDEKILGYTSPLYQCILAMGALFTSNLPYLGNSIFLVSLAGVSVMVFLALRQIGLSLLGFVAACSLILWPAPYNFLGMETMTLAFLVYASFYFFIKRRYAFAAVCISLAIVTRFDAVIAATGLLVLYVAERKRIPWKLLLIGIAVLTPWFIFSFFYYGVILPQTFHAKKSMLSLYDFLTGTIWDHGFPFNPPIDYDSPVALAMIPRTLLRSAGIALSVLGIVFGVRKSRYFILIFLYMMGIALGYTCIAHVEDPWPLFPFTAGMRLFMFFGIHQIAVFVSRPVMKRGRSRLLYSAVLLVLATPLLLEEGLILRGKPESNYFKFLFVSRMKSYRDTGEWLKKHAGPEATVYTPEPGTLAYHSGCIFYDYYGLITKRGWKVPWDEVGRRLRPDYVVIPDGYLGQGSRVPPGYEPVRAFGNPPYPPVRISRRMDLAGGKE